MDFDNTIGVFLTEQELKWVLQAIAVAHTRSNLDIETEPPYMAKLWQAYKDIVQQKPYGIGE